MNMKKILIGIGIFIGLVFLGGAGFYAWYTQSTPYYTQITRQARSLMLSMMRPVLRGILIMPILRWPMMKKATIQRLISTVTNLGL